MERFGITRTTHRTSRPVRCFLAAALPLVVVLAGCGSSVINGIIPPDEGRALESFDIQLDATTRVRYSLEAINGTIIVTGTSATENFIVRGERIVESESQADAEAQLEELQVEVTENGDEILVRTTQPLNDGRNYTVNYQLFVPERLIASIVQLNGNITVDDALNGVTIVNLNGIIILRDVEGSTSVDLLNGEIRATLTIENDQTIDLVTVNGPIDLDIPTETNADLQANVTNGSITLNNLTLENPTSSPTSLTGRLGTGEGTITLLTVNGNITINGF